MSRRHAASRGASALNVSGTLHWRAACIYDMDVTAAEVSRCSAGLTHGRRGEGRGGVLNSDTRLLYLNHDEHRYVHEENK